MHNLEETIWAFCPLELMSKNEDISKDFYKRYVELCVNKGVAPSRAALDMGLSKPTVNGWKTGKANPSTTSAMKVASYFDISYEELFDGLVAVKEKPTAGAVGMSPAEAGRYAIEHADNEDELWQLISRAQERIREMNGKK